MRQSILSLLLFLLSFLALSQSSTQEQIERPSKRLSERLQTFNKLYGYVKYFHPSDETAELDWDAFAIYGVEKILASESSDISGLLEELFKLIGPSIQFEDINGAPIDLDFIKKSFFNKNNLTFYMWVHNGDGDLKEGNLYFSKRHLVNIESVQKQDIFITLKNGKTKIYIPTLVPAKIKETFLEKKSSLDSLNIQLALFQSKYDKVENSKSLTLGNLINVYNSIKHFYPYFDTKMSVGWDKHFEKIIQSVLTEDHESNVIYWLRYLLTYLKDAHVDVQKQKQRKMYPEIFIRYLDGQFVVYHAPEHLADLKGARVNKIDGQSLMESIKKEMGLVSYNVESFGYQEALKNLMGKRPFSQIDVELNNSRLGDTTVSLNCFKTLGQYIELGEFSKIEDIFKRIDKDICYLNLVDLKSFGTGFNLDSLQDCKSVILDVRGYPTLKSQDKNSLISYFLTQDDTLDWLFVPIVSKPNQNDDNFQYKPYGWNLIKNEKKVDSKIFVLIDHMAISYSESIIGYFNEMPNAVLIGSPTAGANGNVNSFELPGRITFEYTGMKVLKHDGSRLHGIGFLPDVEVRPTIKGIIEGRDEVLEKAIELAKSDKRTKTKD